MHQYRIYTFRDDGHFSCVQRIECADEGEAIQKARQLVNRQGGELWRAITLSRDFPTLREQQKPPQFGVSSLNLASLRFNLHGERNVFCIHPL